MLKTRSMCSVSFAHRLVPATLGKCSDAHRQYAQGGVPLSKSMPARMLGWVECKVQTGILKENILKMKLLALLPEVKPLAQPGDANTALVGCLHCCPLNYWPWTQHLQQWWLQGASQWSVVTEAHAALTELVKSPKPVCLSDSSVMFISCVCSANLPQGNTGQKFIHQRFHCCEAFNDMDFACCLAKALESLLHSTASAPGDPGPQQDVCRGADTFCLWACMSLTAGVKGIPKWKDIKWIVFIIPYLSLICLANHIITLFVRCYLGLAIQSVGPIISIL